MLHQDEEQLLLLSSPLSSPPPQPLLSTPGGVPSGGTTVTEVVNSNSSPWSPLPIDYGQLRVAMVAIVLGCAAAFLLALLIVIYCRYCGQTKLIHLSDNDSFINLLLSTWRWSPLIGGHKRRRRQCPFIHQAYNNNNNHHQATTTTTTSKMASSHHDNSTMMMDLVELESSSRATASSSNGFRGSSLRGRASAVILSAGGKLVSGVTGGNNKRQNTRTTTDFRTIYKLSKDPSALDGGRQTPAPPRMKSLKKTAPSRRTKEQEFNLVSTSSQLDLPANRASFEQCRGFQTVDDSTMPSATSQPSAINDAGDDGGVGLYSSEGRGQISAQVTPDPNSNSSNDEPSSRIAHPWPLPPSSDGGDGGSLSQQHQHQHQHRQPTSSLRMGYLGPMSTRRRSELTPRLSSTCLHCSQCAIIDQHHIMFDHHHHLSHGCDHLLMATGSDDDDLVVDDDDIDLEIVATASSVDGHHYLHHHHHRQDGMVCSLNRGARTGQSIVTGSSSSSSRIINSHYNSNSNNIQIYTDQALYTTNSHHHAGTLATTNQTALISQQPSNQQHQQRQQQQQQQQAQLNQNQIIRRDSNSSASANSRRDSNSLAMDSSGFSSGSQMYSTTCLGGSSSVASTVGSGRAMDSGLASTLNSTTNSSGQSLCMYGVGNQTTTGGSSLGSAVACRAAPSTTQPTLGTCNTAVVTATATTTATTTTTTTTTTNTATTTASAVGSIASGSGNQNNHHYHHPHPLTYRRPSCPSTSTTSTSHQFQQQQYHHHHQHHSCLRHHHYPPHQHLLQDYYGSCIYHDHHLSSQLPSSSSSSNHRMQLEHQQHSIATSGANNRIGNNITATGSSVGFHQTNEAGGRCESYIQQAGSQPATGTTSLQSSGFLTTEDYGGLISEDYDLDAGIGATDELMMVNDDDSQHDATTNQMMKMTMEDCNDSTSDNDNEIAHRSQLAQAGEQGADEDDEADLGVEVDLVQEMNLSQSSSSRSLSSLKNSLHNLHLQQHQHHRQLETSVKELINHRQHYHHSQYEKQQQQPSSTNDTQINKSDNLIEANRRKIFQNNDDEQQVPERESTTINRNNQLDQADHILSQPQQESINAQLNIVMKHPHQRTATNQLSHHPTLDQGSKENKIQLNKHQPVLKLHDNVAGTFRKTSLPLVGTSNYHHHPNSYLNHHQPSSSTSYLGKARQRNSINDPSLIHKELMKLDGGSASKLTTLSSGNYHQQQHGDHQPLMGPVRGQTCSATCLTTTTASSDWLAFKGTTLGKQSHFTRPASAIDGSTTEPKPMEASFLSYPGSECQLTGSKQEMNQFGQLRPLEPLNEQAAHHQEQSSGELSLQQQHLSVGGSSLKLHLSTAATCSQEATNISTSSNILGHKQLRRNSHGIVRQSSFWMDDGQQSSESPSPPFAFANDQRRLTGYSTSSHHQNFEQQQQQHHPPICPPGISRMRSKSTSIDLHNRLLTIHDHLSRTPSPDLAAASAGSCDEGQYKKQQQQSANETNRATRRASGSTNNLDESPSHLQPQMRGPTSSSSSSGGGSGVGTSSQESSRSSSRVGGAVASNTTSKYLHYDDQQQEPQQKKISKLIRREYERFEREFQRSANWYQQNPTSSATDGISSSTSSAGGTIVAATNKVTQTASTSYMWPVLGESSRNYHHQQQQQLETEAEESRPQQRCRSRSGPSHDSSLEMLREPCERQRESRSSVELLKLERDLSHLLISANESRQEVLLQNSESNVTDEDDADKTVNRNKKQEAATCDNSLLELALDQGSRENNIDVEYMDNDEDEVDDDDDDDDQEQLLVRSRENSMNNPSSRPLSRLAMEEDRNGDEEGYQEDHANRFDRSIADMSSASLERQCRELWQLRAALYEEVQVDTWSNYHQRLSRRYDSGYKSLETPVTQNNSLEGPLVAMGASGSGGGQVAASSHQHQHQHQPPEGSIITSGTSGTAATTSAMSEPPTPGLRIHHHHQYHQHQQNYGGGPSSCPVSASINHQLPQTQQHHHYHHNEQPLPPPSPPPSQYFLFHQHYGSSSSGGGGYNCQQPPPPPPPPPPPTTPAPPTPTGGVGSSSSFYQFPLAPPPSHENANATTSTVATISAQQQHQQQVAAATNYFQFNQSSTASSGIHTASSTNVSQEDEMITAPSSATSTPLAFLPSQLPRISGGSSNNGGQLHYHEQQPNQRQPAEDHEPEGNGGDGE